MKAWKVKYPFLQFIRRSVDKFHDKVSDINLKKEVMNEVHAEASPQAYKIYTKPVNISYYERTLDRIKETTDRWLNKISLTRPIRKTLGETKGNQFQASFSKFKTEMYDVQHKVKKALVYINEPFHKISNDKRYLYNKELFRAYVIERDLARRLKNYLEKVNNPKLKVAGNRTIEDVFKDLKTYADKVNKLPVEEKRIFLEALKRYRSLMKEAGNVYVKTGQLTAQTLKRNPYYSPHILNDFRLVGEKTYDDLQEAVLRTFQTDPGFIKRTYAGKLDFVRDLDYSTEAYLRAAFTRNAQYNFFKNTEALFGKTLNTLTEALSKGDMKKAKTILKDLNNKNLTFVEIPFSKKQKVYKYANQISDRLTRLIKLIQEGKYDKIKVMKQSSDVIYNMEKKSPLLFETFKGDIKVPKEFSNFFWNLADTFKNGKINKYDLKAMKDAYNTVLRVFLPDLKATLDDFYKHNIIIVPEEVGKILEREMAIQIPNFAQKFTAMLKGRLAANFIIDMPKFLTRQAMEVTEILRRHPGALSYLDAATEWVLKNAGIPTTNKLVRGFYKGLQIPVEIAKFMKKQTKVNLEDWDKWVKGTPIADDITLYNSGILQGRTKNLLDEYYTYLSQRRRMAGTFEKSLELANAFAGKVEKALPQYQKIMKELITIKENHEMIRRTALAMYLKDKGIPLDKIFKEIDNTLVDFNNFTRFERGGWLAGGGIPFWKVTSSFVRNVGRDLIPGTPGFSKRLALATGGLIFSKALFDVLTRKLPKPFQTQDYDTPTQYVTAVSYTHLTLPTN